MKQINGSLETEGQGQRGRELCRAQKYEYIYCRNCSGGFTSVYICQNYQIIHFKYVQLIVWQLRLNKFVNKVIVNIKHMHIQIYICMCIYTHIHTHVEHTYYCYDYTYAWDSSNFLAGLKQLIDFPPRFLLSYCEWITPVNQLTSPHAETLSQILLSSSDSPHSSPWHFNPGILLQWSRHRFLCLESHPLPMLLYSHLWDVSKT